MTEANTRKNTILVITIILVLTVVFGNTAITECRVMGIVPTYYRVIIPILFIICIIWNKKLKFAVIISNGTHCKTNQVFFVMGAIWLLYGIASILISPWSDVAVGIKELMGIFLGLLSIYVLITLCVYGEFNNIISILKLILASMLVIGYIEVFTGWHMSTSMFSDSQYLELLQKTYSDVDVDVFTHNIATSIFYNPNDYCAFLTIMSPIFLYYSKDCNIKIKTLHIVGIGMLFMMLLIDDSFICIIAFSLGTIFYLITSKGTLKKWLSFLGIIGLTYIGGSAVINLIFQFIPGGMEIQMTRLNSMLNAQMGNMVNETGSLLYRINTYTISIAEMFTQSKGLGLGAGSFSKYFVAVADDWKMMSNPHSLWVEIISQYGLIIFFIIIATFIYIFMELCKALKKTINSKYALIMAMGISFIFASFAPSSFLKGTYYWIIFGLALGILSSRDLYLYERDAKRSDN